MMIRKVSFPVLMNAQKVDLKKGINKLELSEWKTLLQGYYKKELRL